MHLVLYRETKYKYFNVRLVKMCFTLQIKNVNDFNKNKKIRRKFKLYINIYTYIQYGIMYFSN